MLFPILQAGLGHALADAAFFDEVFFQSAALLVEEVVGLMDEADGDVGEDFRRAGVHVSPIGLIRFLRRAAELADVESFFGVFVPQGMIADAKVVLIIEEKLLQAGAGDVGELELHLSRSDGGFAGFGDVLLPRAGGLHHLIHGAVSAPEMLFAKAESEVVDDLRLPIGEKVLIVASLRKETRRVFFGRGHGMRR